MELCNRAVARRTDQCMFDEIFFVVWTFARWCCGIVAQTMAHECRRGQKQEEKLTVELEQLWCTLATG
eukprot:350566-Chlamydomonas_euryale.AAC.2